MRSSKIKIKIVTFVHSTINLVGSDAYVAHFGTLVETLSRQFADDPHGLNLLIVQHLDLCVSCRCKL
jgi:hypothetical protein